jgi:hypothetical protein
MAARIQLQNIFGRVPQGAWRQDELIGSKKPVIKVTLTLKSLVVRKSLAGKNVITEAEDIFVIRHQATTGEDIANSENFMCAVVTVSFGVCN